MPSSPASTRRAPRRSSCRCRRTPTSHLRQSRRRATSSPRATGSALEPFSTYQDYFHDAGRRPVRLEATPSYFYGGAAVATKMSELLTNPRVLRDPARAGQLARCRSSRTRRCGSDSPPICRSSTTSTAADALTDADFSDPENEKYMAFRGGCYADFLPAWLETFGTERLHVVWFEELVSDPRRQSSSRSQRGSGSTRRGSPMTRSAPRTGPRASRTRHSRASRLKANDRLERVLRRHPDAKRKLRAFYYKLNGKPVADEIPAVSARRARRPLPRAQRSARSATR